MIKKSIKNHVSGISLIEILVVIAIFSILGVLATRSVLLTLRGTKKSESTFKVRENVNYALGVIERQIRNSNNVDVAACNLNPLVLSYVDQNGASTTFSCTSPGATGYIASGSARLTGTDVAITACSFTCSAGTSSVLPSVTVSVTASDAASSGVESAQVTSSTQIFLRGF